MSWQQLSTYRYISLSTDAKVTEGISFGSKLLEVDKDLDYVFDGSAWVRVDQVRMSWTHKRIHLGKMWHISALYEGVADDANADLVLEVGDLPLHTIYGVSLGGDGHAFLYEAPTVTGATGTAANVKNSARWFGDSGAPIALKNPTITDVGTLLEEGFSPGGSGGVASGGNTNFEIEYSLAANTKYLFRATNKKGQTADGSWSIHSYEFD